MPVSGVNNVISSSSSMSSPLSYAILCDGSFPENEVVLEKLLSCDVVVCCDGAVANFIKYRKPEYVAGDMDSISQEHMLFDVNISHNPCVVRYSVSAFELLRERDVLQSHFHKPIGSLIHNIPVYRVF